MKILEERDVVRALTPKEYFRLMGFDDTDYEILIENGISKSQIYKMAGNSIPVKMLEYLMREVMKLGII